MDIRNLVTKSFDDSAIQARVTDNIEKTTERKEIETNYNVEEKVGKTDSPIVAKLDTQLKECPLADVIYNKDGVLPLSQLYDYTVQSDDVLAANIPVGTSFKDLMNNDTIGTYMENIAKSIFPSINPKTNELDIIDGAKYNKYIPLVIATGTMVAQKDENDVEYFNPNGKVSLAEFLYSLSAIKNTLETNLTNKDSIDKVSKSDDYFNKGYQACLRSVSSPFYKLYTRAELLNPITRLELAYITVICWEDYINKFNSLYGSSYYLGINFDWENPLTQLEKFEDGKQYRVSQVLVDTDNYIVSLNVKDYMNGKVDKISEFLANIKTGMYAIPLPMFMSMIELGILDIFDYEGRLDPMKEVSRGDLCYFITKLSQVFTSKYIN